MRSAAKTGPQAAAGSTVFQPLPTLLSQVLVAFTIEFDNEFEHRSPHRTTDFKPDAAQRAGPWLTSMVMYSNFMRLVDDQGATIGELEKATGTGTLPLAGMERWGYIVVGPDPASAGRKPRRADWVVRATAKGSMAREVWEPLFGVIEERWQTRFGQAEIAGLRQSLWALICRFDVELPEYLPILGYGLFSKVSHQERRVSRVPDTEVPSGVHFPALLSKVLLALTIEFEIGWDLSLAMCADVVRVLDEKGVRLRELPRLSGVSKEAISMGLGVLRKGRYAVIEPDPTASRTKLVRLTPTGREAQDAYHRRLQAIEDAWQTRFGKGKIRKLRESLERLAGDGTAARSPLFGGLEPYPDGWRASVPQPDTLPYYPMVLHRGGYPDGS